MIRWSVLAIRQLEAIDAMISADNPQAAANNAASSSRPSCALKLSPSPESKRACRAIGG
jgi:hypothetical protein